MSAPRRNPRRSTSRGRRSLKFDDELTPRNVIEGMLSVQDTAAPVGRSLSRLMPPPTSSVKKRPRRPSLGVPSLETLVDNTTPRSNIQAILESEPERTEVVAHTHGNKSSTRGSMPDMEGVDINQVDFVPVPLETSQVPEHQTSSRKQPRKLRQLQLTLKTPTVEKSPGRNLRKQKAAGELVFSPGQPEEDPTPQATPDQSQERDVAEQDKDSPGGEEGGRRSAKRRRESIQEEEGEENPSAKKGGEELEEIEGDDEDGSGVNRGEGRSAKRRRETTEKERGDENPPSRRGGEELEELQGDGSVERAGERSPPREGTRSPSRRSTPRVYSKPSEGGAAVVSTSQIKSVSVVLIPINASSRKKASAEEPDGSPAVTSQRRDRSAGSLSKLGQASVVENLEEEKSESAEADIPVTRSHRSWKGTPHPSRSAASLQSTRSTLTKAQPSSVAGDATPMSRSGRKEDKGSREDGDLKTPGASQSMQLSPEARRTLNFNLETAGEASPRLAGHRSLKAAHGASLNAADSLSTTNLDFAPTLSSTQRETGFLPPEDAVDEGVGDSELEEDVEAGRDQTEARERFQQGITQQSAGPPTSPSAAAKQGRTPRQATHASSPLLSASKRTGKSFEVTHLQLAKMVGSSYPGSDPSPEIPIRNRSDQRKVASAAFSFTKEATASVAPSPGGKAHAPVSRRSDVSGAPPSPGKAFPLAPASAGKKSTSLRAPSSGEHSVSTPVASTSRQSTLTSTGRRQLRTPASSSRRTTTYVQTTLPFTNSKSVAETPQISPIRGDPSGNIGDSLGSREWSPALQSPHISPVRSGQTGMSRRDPSPPPMTKTPLAEPATPSMTSQGASGSQSLMSKMSAFQAQQKQAARKVKKPRKRTKNPKEHIPLSTIKSIFTHFTKRRVSADAFAEVERLSAIYWENLAEDLEAYALHRHRKTIDESDIRLLMRRQGFVTDDYSFNAAVENLLPLELRRQLIPIARSGNRIEL